MLSYSLVKWDGLSKTKEFVGSPTSDALHAAPSCSGVFAVSLYYIGASVVQMALALYFATILTFSTKFKNLFKGIIFFPYLINGVAIAFVFLYVLKPDGVLDRPLLGWRGHRMARPPTMDWAIALSSTSHWPVCRSGATEGLKFVLFPGAIQSIPSGDARNGRDRRRERTNRSSAT